MSIVPSFPGLEPLTATGSSAHTAQRFLASAYDSVANLFEVVYPTVRAQRTAERGRLTHAEQDLFRAAVVFSGAGLDASLKELLRATVPTQTMRSESARAKYVAFASKYLGTAGTVDVKRLALILLSNDPKEHLLDAYLRELTGSSLQSVDQVKESLAALGLTDRRKLLKDAEALKPLFVARNQIAHELDLRVPSGQGARSRNDRSMTAYRQLCHDALNFAQKTINATIEEIGDGIPILPAP